MFLVPDVLRVVKNILFKRKATDPAVRRFAQLHDLMSRNGSAAESIKCMLANRYVEHIDISGESRVVDTLSGDTGQYWADVTRHRPPKLHEQHELKESIRADLLLVKAELNNWLYGRRYNFSDFHPDGARSRIDKALEKLK